MSLFDHLWIVNSIEGFEQGGRFSTSTA